MEFYDSHQKQRDRFEVLAFHDASVKTIAELDKKLTTIVAKTWKGRPLPFPILMDSSGRTISDWGIRAWPTQVLIDPQGNVVQTGALKPDEYLAEQLAR